MIKKEYATNSTKGEEEDKVVYIFQVSNDTFDFIHCRKKQNLCIISFGFYMYLYCKIRQTQKPKFADIHIETKKKKLKNTQMLNKLKGHREKPLGREEAIS